MKVERVRIKRKSLSLTIRGVVQHPEMKSEQHFSAKRFVPSDCERRAAKELLESQLSFWGTVMFTQPVRLRLPLFTQTHLKFQVCADDWKAPSAVASKGLPQRPARNENGRHREARSAALFGKPTTWRC